VYIHNVDRRGMPRAREDHFLSVRLLWGQVSEFVKKEGGGNLNRKEGRGCSWHLDKLVNGTYAFSLESCCVNVIALEY